MRISPNETERYAESSNTEWLSLKDDGDTARVQFMYDNYNDLDTFVCHKVKVGDKDRWVDCKRNYDDPIDDCPFCAAGIQQKPVMILMMYDLNDKKVKIWERGRTFQKKMEGLFNRYPHLSNMVFEIERHGARGSKDTKYELYPMPDVEPVDLSEIEKMDLMGTIIMDKTPDDMQVFIDTGSFPPEDDVSQQPINQSMSRRRTSVNAHTADIERTEEPIRRSRRQSINKGEAF